MSCGPVTCTTAMRNGRSSDPSPPHGLNHSGKGDKDLDWRKRSMDGATYFPDTKPRNPQIVFVGYTTRRGIGPKSNTSAGGVLPLPPAHSIHVHFIFLLTFVLQRGVRDVPVELLFPLAGEELRDLLDIFVAATGHTLPGDK